MNSGYSSPYSTRPDTTPIQQILNTEDQQAKYKEDEKNQKAPPELPFEIDRITEVLGNTFVSLAELHRMLNNVKENESVDKANVEELQGNIDKINNLILELPKDIAKISQWVLENYEGTDPLIISGDEEVSIKDLVDLLVQEFNFKGNVIFDSTKPDGQYKKPSDNSKIKELMPDFKYTSFETGIKETVNWFIENYENARK